MRYNMEDTEKINIFAWSNRNRMLLMFIIISLKIVFRALTDFYQSWFFNCCFYFALSSWPSPWRNCRNVAQGPEASTDCICIIRLGCTSPFFVTTSYAAAFYFLRLFNIDCCCLFRRKAGLRRWQPPGPAKEWAVFHDIYNYIVSSTIWDCLATSCSCWPRSDWS